MCGGAEDQIFSPAGLVYGWDSFESCFQLGFPKDRSGILVEGAHFMVSRASENQPSRRYNRTNLGENRAGSFEALCGEFRNLSKRNFPFDGPRVEVIGGKG